MSALAPRHIIIAWYSPIITCNHILLTTEKDMHLEANQKMKQKVTHTHATTQEEGKKKLSFHL